MTIRWDAERYATALRRDNERVARAAAQGLDLAVPSCPGWTMSDLVWHLGEVESFWAEIVSRRLTDWRAVVKPDRPDDRALVEWFRATATTGAADLLELADPHTEVWSWSSQKDVAFVQRRMAHEAALHTWDAVAAMGSREPLDADLAVDGIDEFIDLHMPAGVREAADAGPYSVALRATDRPARWWLEVRGGELSASRSELVADAVVSATASDLLLLLWRRIAATEVSVGGEPTALDRLVERTGLD
jgi:uncharacterized protein (TIGR03083 family)